MQHPAGLALFDKPAVGDSEGTIVCIHGTLDRAKSFTRVARRLEHYRVIAYDRRGYQGSRGIGASADLPAHVDDLLQTIALVDRDGPVTVFGHSLGGVIAIMGGLAAPSSINALIAYESPMRWLIDDGPDWWRPNIGGPEAEAEAFFRLMTSDAAWERLTEAQRVERQADGPALVADLTMVRTIIPFTAEQLSTLSVPVTIGIGSKSDNPRYRSSADVITDAAPVARQAIVEGAGHGAHLSHPDGLAAMLRGAGLDRTKEMRGPA